MDGYVSNSFVQAEGYFKSLLKSNSIPASYRDGYSFVVTFVPRHIQTQFPNQNAWVLDRRVMSAGTVVPQTLWTPHTVTDRRQHVAEAHLQLPIFFVHTNGSLGLSLEAAMSGRCHTLVHAQYCAPLGPPTTTHIRIGVSDSFGAGVHTQFAELQVFSGLGIEISSARFRSATKRLSGKPSR